MIELSELQVQIHMEMLNAQKIYRLLCSPDAEYAFHLATSEQKNKLVEIVNDRNKVKQWIKEILKSNYDTYSMTELRELARHLKIPSYQTKTRDSLLSEISIIMENK